MENVVKEESKNKNLIIRVLVFVIILLLAALVYFVFIKKDVSEEPTKPQNNQQEENNNLNNSNDDNIENNNSIKKDETKEPIKPQDNQQVDNNDNGQSNNNIGTNEEINEYDLLLYSDYGNKKYYGSGVVYVKDISMDSKIANIIDQVEKDILEETDSMYAKGYDSYVSEQRVKEKYESIYNDNYSPVNSGDSGCEKWIRNDDGNYYTRNAGCGSGTISGDPMDEIVSSKKNNDKYEIVAYIPIFDLFDKHELKDYTNDKVILKDSSINEKLDEGDEFEKFNLSQYAKKFQHYKFTFMLRNGNYTLYSVEPVNN